MNYKNPCDCCKTEASNFDRCCECVFYDFYRTEYCKNRDCRYHKDCRYHDDDLCTLGIDPTKCGASGVFEFDKEIEDE